MTAQKNMHSVQNAQNKYSTHIEAFITIIEGDHFEKVPSDGGVSPLSLRGVTHKLPP